MFIIFMTIVTTFVTLTTFSFLPGLCSWGGASTGASTGLAVTSWNLSMISYGVKTKHLDNEDQDSDEFRGTTCIDDRQRVAVA